MNRLQLAKMWCSRRYPPFHSAFLFLTCMLVYETNNNIILHIPVRRDQPFYEYFGTSLSHFSRTHLVSNMIGIFLFGILLEIVHGTWANFSIFWISAGSGVLAEAAWNSHSSRYTGASPGVYGLLGAYLSHIILNFNEAPLRFVWFAFLVIHSIEVGITYTADEEYRENVAHYSHLFGFLQGICVGLITLRNVNVLRFEVLLQIIAFFVSILLIGLPSVWISNHIGE